MRKDALVTFVGGGAAVAALGLWSCSGPASTPEQTSAQSTTGRQDDGLVPAEGERPRAAGACAGPLNGDLGVVEVNPDTPAPRCLVVGPEQGLKVANTTTRFGQPGSPVVARWGPFSSRRLEPGESVTFEQPVGRTFEPGIHELDLDVGHLRWTVEIWVRDEEQR